MRLAIDSIAGVMVVLAGCVLPASALDVPFIEDFASDSAGWTDSGNTAFLDHEAAGGPDGEAFASTEFSFAAGGGAGGSSAVLFRGQDEFSASGEAFVGDWNGDGVRRLTAQVRHDAPLPLSYFARMSGPLNFPGSVAVAFVPVPPNQWTTLEFDLSPTSPQLVSFEGSDYASVFGNVGHIQFGVSIPEALVADPSVYTFGLDNVAIDIPEPGSSMLLALACTAGGLLLRW